MQVLFLAVTQNDIYAQFLGAYVDNQPKTLISKPELGRSITFDVLLNTPISINVEAVKTFKPELNKVYNVEGIFSIYAKNIARGALLTVTKINS